MKRPHPHRWLKQRPIVADATAAVVLCGAGIPMVFVKHGDVSSRDPSAAAVLLVIAMTLPLTFRRRAPIATLLAVVAATATYDVVHYSDTIAGLAPIIATYSVAAHTPDQHQRRVALGVVVSTLSTYFILRALLSSRNTAIGDVIGTTLATATAFVVGDNIRRRRERVADLEDKAARLEHERQLETRDVIARERASIARELHDVVAHSMSVMVVQAAAARRVIANDPERAEQSMRVIEETGRDSLTEMRRILGVLRNGDDVPQLAPQPGVDRIGELMGDAGMVVEFETTGTERPLPTLVDVSAYRIVQEALTNVRKHAGPARARVTLDYAEDGLEIKVDDDGRGAVSAIINRSVGHGIVGMRERAALCGGKLRAGPRIGGGWSVRALLPYESGA